MMLEYISKIFGAFMPPIVVVLLLIGLLFINARIFHAIKAENKNITRGLIAFLLALMGVVAFILVLPIEKELKGQVLGFLGIILSAGIALSSTTVLGNLIAGIMNNSMNRFRNGDLIKIGDFHGRVTKKNILHTEIQLEDSNFITIPNLYIANHPVKLTKKNDTVISTSVSLGYDVPRTKIEKALIAAAISAGLKDPYVYIMALGDFSVVYKIHGFLEDGSKFFSANSLLNAKVMDQLHLEKIEIVSPAFMNQRRVEEQVFIPQQPIHDYKSIDDKTPEDLVFEEAIESEKIELKKDQIEDIEQEQEDLKAQLKNAKDEKVAEQIKHKIEKNKIRKQNIEQAIQQQKEEEK